MDRIHHPSAIATPPDVDAHATPGYPTEGNPGGGIEATVMTAWIGHSIIEEQRNAIVDAGITPDKATITQLRQAIRRLSGGVATAALNANTTLTADHAGVVTLAITANRTFTLPAANAAGGSPIRLTFVRTDVSAFNATINRAGTNTIEGLTSITIPVGGRVTLVSDGVSAWRIAASVGGSGMQSFGASGSFVVPAGVYRVRATVTGGGGAGAGTNGAAGGGQAGATAIGWYDVVPGATVPVTVGAGGVGVVGDGPVGGTSSFGSYASAPGGGGGFNSSGAGGTGGSIATGGQINMRGGEGGDGTSSSASGMMGGMGGASYWGGGGRMGAFSGGGGRAGVAPGSGGGGAYAASGSGTAAGGNGAAGLVVVEW